MQDRRGVTLDPRHSHDSSELGNLVHDDVDKVGEERTEFMTWAIFELQSATDMALEQHNLVPYWVRSGAAG